MSAPARGRSLTDRVWSYADETGQDSRDVYVALIQLINLASPETVDAAFAEMRARRAPQAPVAPRIQPLHG